VIFDTFMFNNEFDILRCRLTELADIPNLRHVLVEADVTHGGNTPKPLHYQDHAAEFAQEWGDRIIHVAATGLPTEVDAWSREHAQREHVRYGLEANGVQPDDIILHGDVDEIPTVLAASMVRPTGFVVFEQRLYCFAVDWFHPMPWPGTVAARYKDVTSFAKMRDARLTSFTNIPDAGWHLSWLGGEEVADAKMRSFCHPEILPEWEGRLGSCYRDGVHVDGTKMVAVDVDGSWPRWVADGSAPNSWFRP